VRWTHADFPAGIDFGRAVGVSLADTDLDGWTDVFCFTSGHLWKNQGGANWTLATDIDALLPPAGVRYGSALGDYDNDGLPDIATEPREGFADEAFHLLKNLGGNQFIDVAGAPAIVDTFIPMADSETNAWADVDGDGDLDLFIPIYPPSVGSVSNKFLHNLGPTGPGGLYRFSEKALAVGLDNPPNAARPEGTFYTDIDDDGDLDLWSNGTMYRNISLFDQPLFEVMDPAAVGIRKRPLVDEGTYFLDYDMDGDLDLMVNYTGTQGIHLWESRGDSTFFLTPESTIEDHLNGATFGMSVADFDLDGDLDMQALTTFRKNLFAETGQKKFVLATHSVTQSVLQGSCTAWGDWDKDGDPDAFISSSVLCELWENTAQSASTPTHERRDIRVQVVRDSPTVPTGLETEFGATVHVLVHGDTKKRSRPVSSASGYLTQNEYALTFALPEDPEPINPDEDVRFDLLVEFPSLPQQGFTRVDKFVNPILGGLDLADFGEDRSIVVFRSGDVGLNGVRWSPQQQGPTTLTRSTDGLAVPTLTTTLPTPTPAAAQEFVGVEIEVPLLGSPVHAREWVLDGIPLAQAASNCWIWDVTSNPPALLSTSSLSWAPENHRGTQELDLALLPGHRYRIVVEMDSIRESPIQGPVDHGALIIQGGLRFIDASPASGVAMHQAVVDPTWVPISLKVAEAPRPTWVDLGGAKPSAQSAPTLLVSGNPIPGQPVTLQVNHAAPLSAVYIVAGDSAASARLGRLDLLPNGELIAGPFFAGPSGSLTLQATWPMQASQGNPFFLQAVTRELGTRLHASSNAIAGL